MAKQVVGLGTVANDGTGDTLRAGGDKINDNFDELYTALGDGSTLAVPETVEDIVGGMLTGNTETLITVTYQDGDGTIDFVVDNDLANYSNATSGFLTAATVEANVDPANIGAAVTGANTFTGTQDFNGQQVEGAVNKVVTSVTGTLTAVAHSGNILKTGGNVTVPTTAGFNCVLIAGGAHTVTFNGTTSAAMATGDIMTILVESGTVIHAVLTAAASKVGFS